MLKRELVHLDDKDARITGIATVLSGDGNRAEVTWRWPRREEYHYCFIYELSENEQENYPEKEYIVEKDPQIIDRRNPRNYKLTLGREGRKCILFAARYDNKSETYLLLDQEDNETEVIKIRPEVWIEIRYADQSWGLFSRERKRKVSLRLSGSQQPYSGSRIVYRCVGGGRDSRKYGIELPDFWNQPIELQIGREERIVIEETKDAPFTIKVKGNER